MSDSLWSDDEGETLMLESPDDIAARALARAKAYAAGDDSDDEKAAKFALT